MGRLILLGRALDPSVRRSAARPAWVDADQRWIARALAAAEARPTGGWFVVDATRAITAERPRRYVISGRSLVVFRDRDGRVVAGPDRCPHMGARLSEGRLDCTGVVCPWHGLSLGPERWGSWRPVMTHDDGVLVWVQLDESGEQPTARPVLPARPETFIDAVVRVEAHCDPSDVIGNRLDPWHGPILHPYAFGRLEVLELGDSHVVVRVAKWVGRPFAIEVDARFDSPERRTIVMTILDGEGQGSVVETHATPIEPGRTAIIEASLATSTRRGFRFAVPLARLIRPFMERAARRLWVDDVRYAERLHELRKP